MLRPCVQSLQDLGHPDTGARAAGETWKQVAVQGTEKPEMVRRTLLGYLGMGMEKPAGEGIGQPGDTEQMC